LTSAASSAAYADVGSLFRPNSFLPDDFVPSKNEIIVGRGKRVVHHEGNRKLREIVQGVVDEYSKAKNRAAKTHIINRVYRAVLADTAIGFVKRDAKTKKYFKMENAAAKTTIAQYFRDALADTYRSSKQYKQKLRDAVKEGETDQLSIKKVGECTMALPASLMLVGCRSLPTGIPQPAVPRSSGVSNYSELRDILSSASALLDDGDDFDWSCDETAKNAQSELLQAQMPTTPHQQVHEKEVSNNENSLLSSLFSAFGKDLDCSTNPFEPTPLAETGLTRREYV